VLQILHNGRADGGQIIDKLKELKIRLELEGEGVVFALLAKMEERGVITGKFDEAMIRKTYQVEEKGSNLLNREAHSVRGINEQVGMLWA
jgi:DNA-binding PadR family transcriptional regulator